MATKKKTAKKNVKKKNSAARKKATARTKSRVISAKSKVRSGKTAKPVARKRATKPVKGIKARTVRTLRSSLPTRGEVRRATTLDLETKGLGAESGGQSGSLQGLSGVEGADSESVSELLEEGNSFEAEIVKGVEDAPDADESEVRTHQRPQETDLDEDFREN